MIIKKKTNYKIILRDQSMEFIELKGMSQDGRKRVTEAE